MDTSLTEFSSVTDKHAWKEILHLLRCPVSGTALTFDEFSNELRTSDGSRSFDVREGIPRFLVPVESSSQKSDVTNTVKEFYEDTPFPNYDDLDSRLALSNKATTSVFARLLDSQLPRPATILEAGCGTGQLTNFLGMGWNRTVVGGDMCSNSLQLAKTFRDRFSINNAHFVQMNLFRPPFPDEAFDVVISNGVLHHTSDPFGGYQAIARKLKPGGYILIGLYNWLGRLPTLWRRWAIERFGDSWGKLDSRLRGGQLNSGRYAAWFRDQYKHPHESKHSIDEVLRWFSSTGIKPLTTIPMLRQQVLTDDVDLFEQHSMGNRLVRLNAELGMLLEGGRDGGLYMVIGQKS